VGMVTCCTRGRGWRCWVVGMTLVQYWMEFKFKILLIYFWLGFDKINKIYSLVESNVA